MSYQEKYENKEHDKFFGEDEKWTKDYALKEKESK